MFGSSSPKACGCPISNIPIFHFLPRLDALHTRCTETPLTVTQFRYSDTFLALIILKMTGYIDPFWASQRCHWKRGALQLLIWFITQHFKITASADRGKEVFWCSYVPNSLQRMISGGGRGVNRMCVIFESCAIDCSLCDVMSPMWCTCQTENTADPPRPSPPPS